MINVESLKEGGIVSIRDYLLEQKRNGKEVCCLESGGPGYPIPDCATEAISKAYKDKETGYTPSVGYPELRELIAEKLINENKIRDITADNVLVTAGAMNGLYIAYEAVFNKAKRELPSSLIFTPCWTETWLNSQLAGFRTLTMSINPLENYAKSKQEQGININQITDVISINTPHNPTGYILNKNSLESIVNFAEKHNSAIISDEAYEHIVYNDVKHISIASLSYENIISVFSASKSYSMAGLRVGYVITKDPILLRKMKLYLRCTANGVNGPAMRGLEAVLKNSKSTKDYVENCKNDYQDKGEKLFNALLETQYLTPMKPEGAFYIWCKISKDWPGTEKRTDSWAMTAYLLEHGIGSSPGTVFYQDGYIRFAYSCTHEMINKACEILPNII